MSTTYEPNFLDYQILGDSQLLRFSEKLLKIRRKSNGDISLGLCVRGQKIEDLLRRVREEVYPISEKLIVMIGTNDILQNTSCEKMCFKMTRLVLELIKNGAMRIILMTLPPIPKLNANAYHWKTLKKFNEFIISLHNDEDIFVINAYAKFIVKPLEKIELKPFGPSQHINRIEKTALSSSIKEECNETHIFLENDPSSVTIKDKFDKSKTLLQSFSYEYNSLSDYTCDSDSCDIKGDIINLKFFEIYFDKNKKLDLIHLNNHGLEQIKKLIINESFI